MLKKFRNALGYILKMNLGKNSAVIKITDVDKTA